MKVLYYSVVCFLFSEKESKEYKPTILKYYNLQYIVNEMINIDFFKYICKYDYSTFVNILLESSENDSKLEQFLNYHEILFILINYIFFLFFIDLNNFALQCASRKGILEIAKLLIEKKQILILQLFLFMLIYAIIIIYLNYSSEFNMVTVFFMVTLFFSKNFFKKI